jgi:hypothetical protein
MKRSARIPGRRFSALHAVALVLGACAAVGAVAHAEGGQARAEYVTKLEARCKPRVLAIERRVSGVRDDVHTGRLEAAGAKFGIAAKIFGASVQSITPIPRPPEDRKQLSTWFRYLHLQEGYMKKISAAFRHGRSVQGQRFIARFVHSGNLANNSVLGFGFKYCAFKFSRFG